MKVELKKFKFAEFASEETNCYSAELWVNGKLAAYCSNSGKGESDYFRPADAKLLKEVEAYAKSLPPVKYRNTELPMDLELFVGEMVEKILVERAVKKANKKIEKLTENAIVWGVPNTGSYTHIKFNLPIKAIMMSPVNKEKLRQRVEQVKAELKEGEVIFNTNLNF